MKICGCVIWYNPSEEDKENIGTYLDGIDKLFIIDNSSEINYLNNNPKIEYIPLYNNFGIARALNIACEKAKIENYEWILTMDQDSRFDKNIQDYKVKCQKKYNKNNLIVLFAATTTFDKESGFVNRVITSGNILNLEVWSELGGFKEDFFIDEVDFELCAKIILKGYLIYKFQDIKLNHTIGNNFNINFLGLKTYCMNHSYIRKYYIVRNRLFMRRMYPTLTKRYLIHILLDFYKVVFYEEYKLKKIKYMLLGINDYFKNKKGKKIC